MKMDQSKYDPDGKLKNGISKEYFKDGTLSCAGEYKNGEKTGEWKYYLRNGSVKAAGRFSKGKMVGEWSGTAKTAKCCRPARSMKTNDGQASGKDFIQADRCMTRASTSRTRRLVSGAFTMRRFKVIKTTNHKAR
jgi:hypothetical protein